MLTRIAPTPSGFLHAGNLCSFYLTRTIANNVGAQLLLRIDDLDNDRYRQVYLEHIFTVLKLFKINYDAGPKDIADFNKNFSQQLRINYYLGFVEKLVETGRVYACTCSRKKMALLKQNGTRRCHCMQSALPLNARDAALKLFVPDNTIINIHDMANGEIPVMLDEVMGDFVIGKKDGTPSYQVASLCDDVVYGVDYIVRGNDLLPSTAAQLYMALITNTHSFTNSKFLHHSLVTDNLGYKLSKSAGNRLAGNLQVDEKNVSIITEYAKAFTANVLNQLNEKTASREQ